MIDSTLRTKAHYMNEDNIQRMSTNVVEEAEDEDKNLTINEEVVITEYAPAIFNCIKEMDGVQCR